MNIEPQLDEAFGALSNATRRQIVTRLCAKPDMSALQIADMFDSAQPTISKHLKVLEKAGLVVRRIEGKRHIFSVNTLPLKAVADWSERHTRLWRNSLNQLSDYLDEAAHDDNS